MWSSPGTAAHGRRRPWSAPRTSSRPLAARRPPWPRLRRSLPPPRAQRSRCTRSRRCGVRSRRPPPRTPQRWAAGLGPVRRGGVCRSGVKEATLRWAAEGAALPPATPSPSPSRPRARGRPTEVRRYLDRHGRPCVPRVVARVARDPQQRLVRGGAVRQQRRRGVARRGAGAESARGRCRCAGAVAPSAGLDGLGRARRTSQAPRGGPRTQSKPRADFEIPGPWPAIAG
jgi:hypothetical protein